MKVDCQWLNAHLEAFFSESLEIEESQLASEHLKTCVSCRSEVQALRKVDPLVKQLLQYRMEKAIAAAHAPRRSAGFQLGLAGAVMAFAAVLTFVILTYRTTEPDRLAQTAPAAQQNSDSPKTQEAKDSTPPPILRVKPDALDPKSAIVKAGPEPPVPADAPEFQVITPEGYAKSLQDYRGRVLIVGVWHADQPEAAQNLQRLYQAFGTRREVQILGVAGRNQQRLAGETFPLVFNNGSRLLETHNSDFVVVDKEGNVQMRGSLMGDPNALIAKLRLKLDELGGR